ncbi:hypothetical protein GN956_G5863 [Arapaima gigas]
MIAKSTSLFTCHLSQVLVAFFRERAELERESGTSVLQLHVEDKDQRGTAPLDYEVVSSVNLSASVVDEEVFSPCVVKYSRGLWDVVTFKDPVLSTEQDTRLPLSPRLIRTKATPTQFWTTLTLVNEPTVQCGTHQLQLRISNAQGQLTQRNLSVTVCTCSHTSYCWLPGGSKVLTTTVGVILATLFLLLGSSRNTQ